MIESRPIAARPVSIAGRLLRWARRQPAAATLAAVLVLGIPALAGLGTYIVVRQPLVREAELAAQRRASEALVEQGFLAAEDGDREEAIAAFERAVVDGEIVPEALAGIVWTHLPRRTWSEAIAVLDAHPRVVGRYAGLRALRTWFVEKQRGASDIDALNAATFEPARPGGPLPAGPQRHRTRRIRRCRGLGIGSRPPRPGDPALALAEAHLLLPSRLRRGPRR